MITCGKCGESIQGNWKNIVLVKDKAFHRVCYNEEQEVYRVLPLKLSNTAFNDLERATSICGFENMENFIYESLYSICQSVFSVDAKRDAEKNMEDLIGN